MKTIFEPRCARRVLGLLTASSLLTLSACGGGGGGGGDQFAGVSNPGPVGGGAGIGGTGFASSGTVDGTGSIFVNGVRYEIDDADIFIDGEAATEADLALGMVVRVTGTREDGSQVNVAERVDYAPLVEGTIDGIVRNEDNSSARLDVVGQTVIIERTSTVFEDRRFDDLGPGDWIEVSGFRDAADRIRATRVDYDNNADGEVSLRGVVAELAGNQFRIGGQIVDASGANLDDLPGGLANGQAVDVDGVLDDGLLVASDIGALDSLGAATPADSELTAQGAISGFASTASFVVDGVPVNAATAEISTGGLPLDNGLIVEVDGTWNGSVLNAARVTARRGRIELAAPIADIDGNTLTLQFGNGTVSVSTDARTLLDDDRDDIEYLALGDLAIGDYVEIEALQVGTGLLATRLDRDDDSDETRVQAPVSAFAPGQTVTLLGLTYTVSAADFENAADDDINAGEFFQNLSVGALIEVTDDEPADGFAEEIEFEFAFSLDGDREFLDDDEDRIAPEELPAAAAEYLAANFPGASIAFVQRDDDEIEVYLADGTEIVFALDGTFLEADIEDEDDDNDDDSDDGAGDDDDESGDDSDDDGDDDAEDGDDDSGDDEDESGDDSDDDGDDDAEDGDDDADEDEDEDGSDEDSGDDDDS